MKKWLVLCLCFCLLMTGAAFGEAVNGVVVNNHFSLQFEVNEKKSDLILIAEGYKHNTRVPTPLRVEAGRTVTIRPAKGESALLRGRIDIEGEGTVIFEGIRIVAPAGSIGLRIGGGAHVRIDSVTGGEARGNDGNTAVIIRDSELEIGFAAGSDGKSGMGGDGVYAFGHSVVQIREARGGNAPKGVGGAGVVVFGGAEVTVTGSATGGDGLYGAGKGVLVGLNASAAGEGDQRDGAQLESKKTVDPDDISTRALLENALRNGKTEIRLNPKFKGETRMDPYMYAFTPAGGTIRVIGNPDGKHPNLGCQFTICTGEWIFDGVDNTVQYTNYDPCLQVLGDGKVIWNGNLTGNGRACGLYAGEEAEAVVTGDIQSANTGAFIFGSARAVINGNVTSGGKNESGLETGGHGDLTMNGDVSTTRDAYALTARGGKINMTGTVRGKANRSYPTIYISAGEIRLQGDVLSDGTAHAIHNQGGDILIEGNVSSGATKKVPIRMTKGAGNVTIHGNVTVKTAAAEINGGILTIDGNLILKAKLKKGSAYNTSGDGQVIVTGEERIEAQ